VWDDGAHQLPFDQALEYRPTNVQYSPCGRWFSICGKANDGAVHFTLCDAQTGKQKGSEHGTSAMCWWSKQKPIAVTPMSPDGSEVALVHGFTVRRSALATGKVLSEWQKPPGREFSRF